jgi:hypothetical protein
MDKVKRSRLIMGVFAFAVVFLTVYTMSRAPRANADTRWSLSGQMSDGERIQFVTVTNEAAKDRSAYEAAIRELCGGGKCVVAFFLPGDRLPPSGSNQQWYPQGAWANYPLVAFWDGRQYTRWNCERAGSLNAPPEARCDLPLEVRKRLGA